MNNLVYDGEEGVVRQRAPHELTCDEQCEGELIPRLDESRFRPGQSVRVKDGVVAPDQPEIEIGGWQGWASDILREKDTGKLLVFLHWDATTINALPDAYLEYTYKEGQMPHCITLYDHELEGCDPRDTKLDTWFAVTRIVDTESWEHAGDIGLRIMETIAEALYLSDAETKAFAAWKDALENRMRFPFEARAYAPTPDGWKIQNCDLLTITGLDENLSDFGLLAKVIPEKHAGEECLFPLSHLIPVQSHEETETALTDYRCWYEYRESPELLLGEDDLLDDFYAAVDGILPEDALQQALLRKREFLPLLIGIMEETRDYIRHEPLDKDCELYWQFLFSLYLLAYWRESRALPILCDILQAPAEHVADLIYDGILGDLGRILASFCVELKDEKLVKALIRNPDIDDMACCGALRTWLSLSYYSELSREMTVGFFIRLYDGGFARVKGMRWGELAICCAHLHITEIGSAIEQSFEEGLVPQDYLTEKDVENTYAMTKEEALASAFGRTPPLIANPVWEFEQWDYFQEEWDFQPGGMLANILPRQSEEDYSAPAMCQPETIHHEEPKVRPNDSCPCGSGKKHKKCCGR